MCRHLSVPGTCLALPRPGVRHILSPSSSPRRALLGHGAFAFEEDTPVWAELLRKEAARGAEPQASARHLAGTPWLHVGGQTMASQPHDGRDA